MFDRLLTTFYQQHRGYFIFFEQALYPLHLSFVVDAPQINRQDVIGMQFRNFYIDIRIVFAAIPNQNEFEIWVSF